MLLARVVVLAIVFVLLAVLLALTLVRPQVAGPRWLRIALLAASLVGVAWTGLVASIWADARVAPPIREMPVRARQHSDRRIQHSAPPRAVEIEETVCGTDRKWTGAGPNQSDAGAGDGSPGLTEPNNDVRERTSGRNRLFRYTWAHAFGEAG